MIKQVRVNVLSLANVDATRKETRNGRDVLVVPSATLPDDVVMNNVMYPAHEIEASFETLNRTPAPYGHPMVNGSFVSASDPEGINQGYIGAWNENAVRRDGRVFLDKVIDVEVANRSAQGREVLEAINSGDPVHTSTGLLCNIETVEHDDYDSIARNIYFDHDAILVHQEGAATPEQGVGMMVNGEEIDVINSSLMDMVDDNIDWAGISLLDALDRKEKVTFWQSILPSIMEAFTLKSTTNGEDMAVDQKQFDALSEKVNNLSETLEGLNITEAVTNAVTAAVEPLTKQLGDIAAANVAADEAETATLVEKIVKANLLDEETAKETPLATLRALGNSIKPQKAAPMVGTFVNADGVDEDPFKDADLNANMKSEAA